MSDVSHPNFPIIQTNHAQVIDCPTKFRCSLRRPLVAVFLRKGSIYSFDRLHFEANDRIVDVLRTDTNYFQNYQQN
jgi:hypothetical protein